MDGMRAVENLADIAIQVASLVTLNAGIAVSVDKVNITIADVDAELELQVRLGEFLFESRRAVGEVFTDNAQAILST